MKQGGTVTTVDAILIIGAGGHAAVVLDALQASGYTGRVAVWARTAVSDKLLSQPVHIGSPDPSRYPPADWRVHVAIGDNALRGRIAGSFTEKGYGLATIRHPTAVVSAYAHVGPGSALMAGAVINPRARIGRGAILNSRAVVEHDCSLGDWCHVSPGAIMAGDSHAGNACWLGAGSVLRQGVRLSDDITIGANSVVLDDLMEPGAYVGSPAMILRKDKEP